jgi:hypothetical protein
MWKWVRKRKVARRKDINRKERKLRSLQKTRKDELAGRSLGSPKTTTFKKVRRNQRREFCWWDWGLNSGLQVCNANA